MTAVDPERARDLLEAALATPPERRDEVLCDLCAGDAALLAELRSLLEALPTAERLFAVVERAPASLTGLSFRSYVVGERIAEGGMGVVYRARDTRLGRDVAIKALPPDLANRPERLALLEREARTLAAIAHPNIAAIYGLEDSPRGVVLVLELVPGATLAARVAAGRLPIDETILIARDIARGLEAAHAVGIVHRDLKPQNIGLTPDGAVKVLDFGIADPPPERAGDIGTPLVAAQPFAGTVAYMSPEALRGKRIDRRADLWSFGCVVYEMLTGSRPFQGTTTADVVGSVLQAEPDWSRLPPRTPPSLRRLLLRLLRKDATARLHDAADARLDLDDAERELSAPVPPPPRRRGTSFAIAAVTLAAFLGGLVVASRETSAPEVVRFSLRVPERMPLAWDIGSSFAVSPDGSSIAYAGFSADRPQTLFVRRFDEPTARAVAPTELLRTPAYAADGRTVLGSSVVPEGLTRTSLESGATEVVVAEYGDLAGIAALDDGRVVYGHRGALRVCNADGSGARDLTTIDRGGGELREGQPCAVGDAIVLFTARYVRDGRSRLVVEAVRVDTGERKPIVEDAWTPGFVAPDLVFFVQGEWVMAARLDRSSLALVDEPAPVLGPLARANEPFPPPRYSVSSSGMAAYLQSEAAYRPTRLAWVDADGTVASEFEGNERIETVRLSPDASRAALAIGDERPALWMRDIARGAMTRLSPDDGASRDYPFWAPDGKRLHFTTTDADRARVECVDVDRAWAPRTLLEVSASSDPSVNGTTPDGAHLLVALTDAAEDRRDLFLVPIDGGAPTRLLDDPGSRLQARFSPDGTALAYTEILDGSPRIIVQPWPALDRRTQVSTRDGFRPEWRGDGGAILYRVRHELVEVELATDGSLRPGRSKTLFDTLPESRYDIAAERDGGMRILAIVPPGPLESDTHFGVVRHVDQLARQRIAERSTRR
ncbi:MAG: serine/threonine-protein kinase [Phycisphaerae bacterium]|nr:serine/threonine-protein kinase [Phycisphaerae bacterium]